MSRAVPTTAVAQNWLEHVPQEMNEDCDEMTARLEPTPQEFQGTEAACGSSADAPGNDTDGWHWTHRPPQFPGTPGAWAQALPSSRRSLRSSLGARARASSVQQLSLAPPGTSKYGR
jgi:hypothetical protein